jgi:hypothetical protein
MADLWPWVFGVVAVVLGVAGAWLIYWSLLRDRARGRRRCPKCWYDLAGVPGLRCPECGREARRERSLRRTRRRWRVALLGAVTGALGLVSGLTGRAIATGSWWRAIPEPLFLLVAQVYDDSRGEVWDRVEEIVRSPTRPSDMGCFLAARYLGRAMAWRPPPPKSRVIAALSATWGASSRADTSARLLQSMGPRARGAVGPLRGILAVDRHFQRGNALDVLASIGPGAAAALPNVRSAFDTADDSIIRLRAVVAGYMIGGASPATRELLDAAADDSSALVRCAAMDGLEYLHQTDAGAVGIVTRLLSDPVPFIRGSARVALDRMGGKPRASAQDRGGSGPP